MDPINNPFAKKSGYLREDGQYVWYRDQRTGKVQKFTKHNPDSGKIRLRLFEKPLFYWKRLQVDQKANIFAFSLFLLVPYVVYKAGLYFTERDLRV